MKPIAFHCLWICSRIRPLRKLIRRLGLRIDREWYRPEAQGKVFHTGRTFLMSSFGNELTCRSYWMEDYYEPLSMIALRSLEDRVSNFIDIGSNVGIFSLFVASERQESPTRVFAFEPNPEMRVILETNCRINHFQIDISPLALSEGSGTAKFYQPESDTSGCLDEDFNPDVVGEYTVETATLDEVFCGDDKLDPYGGTIVKMDVLGHESSILRGGHQFIEEFKPTFLLEAVRDFDPGEIEFLRKSGYSFHLILPGGLEEITEIRGREKDGFCFANFFATPDPGIPKIVNEALRNFSRKPRFAESSLQGFDANR